MISHQTLADFRRAAKEQRQKEQNRLQNDGRPRKTPDGSVAGDEDDFDVHSTHSRLSALSKAVSTHSSNKSYRTATVSENSFGTVGSKMRTDLDGTVEMYELRNGVYARKSETSDAQATSQFLILRV